MLAKLTPGLFCATTLCMNRLEAKPHQTENNMIYRWFDGLK